MNNTKPRNIEITNSLLIGKSETNHIVISVVNRIIFLKESITENPERTIWFRDIKGHESSSTVVTGGVFHSEEIFMSSEREFNLFLSGWVVRIFTTVFKDETMIISKIQLKLRDLGEMSVSVAGGINVKLA
jgi:hypothetical protein